MTVNHLPPISAIGTPSGTVGPVGQPGRFKPVDPARVLRQYLALFIVTAVIGVVLGVGAWGLLLTYAPSHRSMAQLLVRPGIQDPTRDAPGTGGQGGNMAAIDAYIMNQVHLLGSQPILNNVLEIDEVRRTAWGQQFVNADGQFDMTQAREDFEKRLRVAPLRNSMLIQVSFSDKHRTDVALILRHLLAEYHRWMDRLATSESSRVKQTFSAMVLDADRRLERMAEQMQRFLETEGITSLQPQLNEAYQLLNIINQQYQEAVAEEEAALAALQSAAQIYEQEGLAPSPEEQYLVDQTRPVADRMERVRLIDERIEVLLATRRAGPSHPDVLSLEEQKRAAERAMELERTRQLQEIRAVRLEAARKAHESATARRESLEPQREEAHVRMVDLNMKLEQYDLLRRQEDQARLEREEINNLLRTIDFIDRRPDAARVVTSVPPTEARLVFPLPQVVIPGVAILSLLMVGGLVFLREMLDQRIKSPSDVKLLSDVELLGMLPDANEDPSGAPRLEDAVRHNPAGLLAESFRQVRTSLLSRMDRRGYKTLMLVGAQPQAGVSAVTANLAASFAFNGRKVLVLDANFRRPSQHEQFGLSPDVPGLADVLTGRTTVEQAIVRLADPEIDVLPAGGSAGAYPEQLEGAAFRNLLATLESQYDLVLIDAPPALLTSDASLLAKQVDAIAVVVRAMRQKRGMIDRLMRQMDGHRGDVLGVILNGVRSSAGGYFRESYREFYKYANGKQGRLAGGKGAPRLPAGSNKG